METKQKLLEAKNVIIEFIFTRRSSRVIRASRKNNLVNLKINHQRLHNLKTEKKEERRKINRASEEGEMPLNTATYMGWEYQKERIERKEQKNTQ